MLIVLMPMLGSIAGEMVLVVVSVVIHEPLNPGHHIKNQMLSQ